MGKGKKAHSSTSVGEVSWLVLCDGEFVSDPAGVLWPFEREKDGKCWYENAGIACQEHRGEFFLFYRLPNVCVWRISLVGLDETTWRPISYGRIPNGFVTFLFLFFFSFFFGDHIQKKERAEFPLAF